MTTAPGKKSMGTMAIVGVLIVVLLVGTLMFGYFGYQLLAPKPAQQAAAPKGTPTRTPTPVRTGVVIVASTEVPNPSGAEATATLEGGSGASTGQDTTATPTRKPTKKATTAPGGTGGGTTAGGGKLPQTGLGLGTPVFGLLLAGLASAARRLRQR